MADHAEASPYRWVIEVLVIAALLAQAVIWLAPAPILGPIIEDLHVNLAAGGLIISIIALCIAVFSFVGAVVVQRLGTLRTLLLGVWLLAASATLSGYTQGFAGLLLCRIIEGLGFGLMISPPGTLVMQWFRQGEWPYINMVNALCSYVGLTAVYTITAPIYLALGSSWRTVLRDYGLAAAVIAVLWTVLGRERNGRTAHAAADNIASVGSVVLEVLRMRDVELIALALFGGMWVFQLYAAFLPQFFRSYRGMSLSAASSLTAVLPITGMLAAAAGGLGTAVSGLRKPFTWPVALCTLAGCIGALTLQGLGAMRFSLVLFGIGSAASLAAITTMLMELPGMTPLKMGTGLALVWSVGYVGAFVSPFLGGALADALGLRGVMLGCLLFQLIPIVAFYLLPETGPGRAKIEVAPAASAP